MSELSGRIDDLPQPIRVLGNGSNVLMSETLRGTVILTREESLAAPEIVREEPDEMQLILPAGMFLPSLSKWTADRALTGAEFMVGVPGTIGGAVVQNAGANEQKTSSLVVEVEAWDLESAALRWVSAADAEFAYRSSRFQREKFLLRRVKLRLKRGEPEEIQARLKLNLDYRRQKTPFSRPSLGSMFTRIPKEDGDWWYPGQLIESVGLKGFRRGQTQISEVHANYFVNLGGARFSEVLSLMDLAQERVLKETGLELRPEVQIWQD